MISLEEITSIEHKEMLKYCEDIIKVAPATSVEYKIAKLALIQLTKEDLEIVDLCKDIKENSPSNTPQNKIAQMVLSQYEKDEPYIPEGWTLVPIVPVFEMFSFIPLMARMTINRDEYDVSQLNEKNATWIYNHMLNKAPQYKK